MYPSDENSKLWTAGVFDGDGCVSANPRGGGVSVMFDQAEKGWKMLRRLHELWGGLNCYVMLPVNISQRAFDWERKCI